MLGVRMFFEEGAMCAWNRGYAKARMVSCTCLLHPRLLHLCHRSYVLSHPWFAFQQQPVH